MKAISLMYHDVVSRNERDSSGFPGADAALYKIAPDQFRKHLQSIARSTSARPQTAFDLKTQPEGRTPLFITFDDGGISAFTTIAPMLEDAGWRGLFFVTAGCVAQRSFMTPDQIRELHSRGHIIGSHSLSHPLRMSSCSWDKMIE